ncbi:MAG: HAMP domain-containing sensor histidine kinase [Lachnospiraceae bacterium]|nr:HAMP domain-containing sensor histidine kinase [Lachnospiraceae bacterium]
MKIIGSKKTSIYMELLKLLFIGFIVAGSFLVLMNLSTNYLMDRYFENTSFQQKKNDEKMEKLQDYVTKNHVMSNDSATLSKWIKKNNLAYLQVFLNDMLRYDSSYTTDENGEEWEVTQEDYFAWEEYYTIIFADGEADVFSSGISLSSYYNYALLIQVVLAFVIFIFIVMMGIRKTMAYICTLNDEIKILESGELERPITIERNDELTELAQGLNEMRLSFQAQLDQENYLTSSHKKLVTEMSHDLRTPLTSLLIYTEILKQNKGLNPEILEKYTKKIDKKAHQIKTISDNIFEYSLISSHMDVELDEPQPIQAVFYDLLSEFTGYLKAQGYAVTCNLDWKACKVRINSDYLIRIMDNMASNIVKYADKEAPIEINTMNQDNMTGISIKNKISDKECVEVSTQIGLHNIKNMMESMGGLMNIVKDEDTFEIDLLFRVDAHV